MKTTEQKVLKFIDRHRLIDEGDKILVALSGGPDSVFALYFLKKYERRLKINKLSAIHVHHQLRGGDADEDEQFCGRLCQQHGIQFHAVKVNVKQFAEKNKFSIEEAARFLRYGSFRRYAELTSSNKIVTAHNMNDNAETMLFNLFKGAGLKGISGIPIQRQEIIRPFLSLTKQEILGYLDKGSLTYRTDKTNFNLDFKRNYIRSEIIPRIKEEINPQLEEALFHSSEIFTNSARVIQKQVDNVFVKNVRINEKQLHIDTSIAEEHGKEILGEVFKRALKQYFKYEMSFDEFIELNKLYFNETGKSVTFGSGLTAIKERTKIVVQTEDEEDTFEPVEIKAGSSVQTTKGVIGINIEKDRELLYSESGSSELISADNTDDIFILRRWKNGDKFIPLGMKGFKNISDFLNEQKIPPSLKREQLVLTNDNNIVWVVGYRIDDRYKVNNDTKKIYKLCLS